MTRRAVTMLALAGALLTAAPAAAAAASSSTPKEAITDCNDHGRLTATYPPDVLRQALGQMPADVREYTDCFDVIQRQLLAEQGQGGSVSGGGSGSSSSGSFLPAWLIVVIVLLALAAVTLGVMAQRRRSQGPPNDPGPPDGPTGPGEPPGAGA